MRIDERVADLNAFDGVDSAIEKCRQTVYLEGGFATRWEKMLPADRLVLHAVAAGETDLHGARSLANIGEALELGRPAHRSVPQNALRRLRDRQVLIQSETGVYRFEDETFGEWVRTERLGK